MSTSRHRNDFDGGPAAAVSLDGVANGGRPGEGDNVTAVENFTYVPHGTYVLSDAAETIVALSEGAKPAAVESRGGDDVITACTGADRIDAGSGADIVKAGYGDDTITGGPGRDRILADDTSAGCGLVSCDVPFGNDKINARDGEVDSIDCGPGTDSAVVDPDDVVANCERVDTGSSEPCCTPPRPDPNLDPDPSCEYSLEILSKLSVRQVASKGLRIRVSCPAACSLKGSVLVDKATARRLKLGKSRRLAIGSGKLAAAGNSTVTLKIAKKAKARFKRLRKAKLSLVVVATRSDGKSQKLTRSLRLGK